MPKCKKHCLKQLEFFGILLWKKERSTWFLEAALRARTSSQVWIAANFPVSPVSAVGYPHSHLCTTAPKSTPDRDRTVALPHHGWIFLSSPAQQEIIRRVLKSYGWSTDALLAAPKQLDPGIGANPRVTVRSAALLGIWDDVLVTPKEFCRTVDSFKPRWKVGCFRCVLPFFLTFIAFFCGEECVAIWLQLKRLCSGYVCICRLLCIKHLPTTHTSHKYTTVSFAAAVTFVLLIRASF